MRMTTLPCRHRPSHRMTTPHSPWQRGISLIESLVAIVVMALGILGILGVQMRTLADTQTGVRRAHAIRLIEDLSERIKSQPNALGNLGSYARTWDAASALDTATDCKTSVCTPAKMATYDLNRWMESVRATMPLGDAAVFLPKDNSATDPRQLGVMLSWRANEAKGKTADDTNEYKAVFAVSTKNAADQTIACPTDRICHLQFISPNQRCIPDTGVPAGVHCPTP